MAHTRSLHYSPLHRVVMTLALYSVGEKPRMLGKAEVPLPFNSSIFLYRTRSWIAQVAMWQDDARPDIQASGPDHFIHSCL